MGTLSHFNLPGIIDRYGLRHFVETGTGTGESLALAAAAPFVSLHSVEIVASLAKNARGRFAADKRIKVWGGDSCLRLPEIMRAIPRDEPIMFWLDAHFAGADYGLAAYDAESNLARRLPLEAELEAIADHRDTGRDIFVLDDARIYQPGPYGLGDLPSDFPGIVGLERSLDFVRNRLAGSHGIVVDYAGTGFVMCCPRMTYERVNG